MTKYVIYDKGQMEYLETIYKTSTSFDRYRGNALEVNTIEEAKAVLSVAKARASTRQLVIRVTEITENEFDPDAPHIK